MTGKKNTPNRFLLIGAIVLVAVLAFSATKLLGQKQGQSIQVNSSKATRIAELTDKLNNDPSYRDKDSQAYKEANKEFCLLTARPSEEREKAIVNIRDFLDSKDMVVDFNCSRFEGSDYNKVKEEIYSTPIGYFVIDPKTNFVLQMQPEPGRWGYNADGTRWSTPEQQYDYTSRYTKTQAEELARKFLDDHKKSLGDISLADMSLETGQKDGGGDRVNYFFKWTGKGKTTQQETQCSPDMDKNAKGVFYDENGAPCLKVNIDKHPTLSMTVTSGGQVVVYSNELATR